MKINYQNTLDIIGQGNNEFKKLLNDIFDHLPPVVVTSINRGAQEGLGLKKGHSWEYKDNGEQFNLFVSECNCPYPKDCFALTLASLNKRILRDWPEYEEEKTIGRFTVYLYNKEKYNIKKLKITYDFNLKVVAGRYIVSITTDTNTANKVDGEILKANGMEEFHKSMVGLNYVVDVSSITGEDRTKRNKMKII